MLYSGMSQCEYFYLGRKKNSEVLALFRGKSSGYNFLKMSVIDPDDEEPTTILKGEKPQVVVDNVVNTDQTVILEMPPSTQMTTK